MCLRKVIINYKRPQYKVRTGWKVFRATTRWKGQTSTKILKGALFGGDRPLPIGKWINEKDFRVMLDNSLTTCGGQEYHAGFHCFAKKDDADYVNQNYDFSEFQQARKVRAKGITARGTQENDGTQNPCFVARWIKILPLPTDKVKHEKIRKPMDLTGTKKNA